MALPYFFYGTLMDMAVLRTVLGRDIPPSCRRAAAIGGYRRVFRDGAWYPILIADPDAEARVEGVVVSGVMPGDAARLAAFEGSEYALAEVTVVPSGGGAIRARAFLPVAGVPGSDREWTLREWRRRHRREYLRRTRRASPRGTGWW